MSAEWDDALGESATEQRNPAATNIDCLSPRSSLVFAAARQGDKLSIPDERLPLALAGGLLTGEPAYRAVGPVQVVSDPALSAARGFLGLA